MRRYSVLLLVTLSLATSVAQANSRYQSMPQQGSNGGNTMSWWICHPKHGHRQRDVSQTVSAAVSLRTVTTRKGRW